MNMKSFGSGSANTQRRRNCGFIWDDESREKIFTAFFALSRASP
ncbi:hypothetical protein [Caballeronia sp. LZ024]|nr:hypothetical protein [Caballeronia sp. LZ024]MDR5753409.1 hypothetical protein [Caballeronia sp. LZ024]